MTDLNSTRTLLDCEPFNRHAAFTLWRIEPNRGDPTKQIKVPVHYDGITHHDLGDPRRGRPPNPAPPLNAEQAAGWLAHHRSSGNGHATPRTVGYLGAGFRPAGTGLVCIDADDCVTPDGQWTPEALALMARFPGALIEVSISGTGLHIWFTVTGEGPGKRTKQKTPLGALEVYSEGQFIACGTVLAGDASTDHTAAVQALVSEFWPERRAVREDRANSTEWDAIAPDEQVRIADEVRSTFPHLDQSTYARWQTQANRFKSMGDDVGRELWHEFSERDAQYTYEETESKWWDAKADRTGYQAFFVEAKEANTGWENPRARKPLGEAAEVFQASAPGITPLIALPAGAVLERPTSVPDPASTELSFMAASQGLIAATVASVETALLSEESGVKIAYDTFKDRVSISIKGSPWRPFRDTDYGRLRAAFERRGFKPVPAEAMSTAVGMVAEANMFDSAIEWANGLRWDGQNRIDAAMIRYYGCEDTPYTRAVGAYLFTALAGRCLVPGIKADMALILVGLQGAQKTSSIEVLCPEHEAFGEADLNKRDTDLARAMRGKLIVELAELNGLAGRDQEAIKAWISRRVEEWTPKYKEMAIKYLRRCILVGTDNKGEFLDDPTGARRFLPAHVGSVDLKALESDRDQLWAEGVVRFRESGIAWQEAERLARAEHHKFEVVDELLNVVEQFLASPPPPMLNQPVVTTPRSASPIRGADIISGALGKPLGQITKSDQMALAKIMRRLGYRRDTARINGVLAKVWTKVVT